MVKPMAALPEALPLATASATIGGQKYLLLSDQNIKSGNINMNVDRSKFNYAADIYGGQKCGRAL